MKTKSNMTVDKKALIFGKYDWLKFIQTQSGHDLIHKINEKEIIFDDGENKHLVVKHDRITPFFIDKKKHMVEFNKILSKYTKWQWIMSYDFLIFKSKQNDKR